MKIQKLLPFVAVLLLPFLAIATVGSGHVYGEVEDITSTSDGLLIRILDQNGNPIVPNNCQSPSQYGWMLVSNDETAMISVILMMRARGERTASVYTNPTTSGYCDVR